MRFLASVGHRTFIVARILSLTPQLTKLRQTSTTAEENIQRLRVKTFGSLKTRTGSLCDVNIKPVDPQLCPDQNLAFVNFVKSELPLTVTQEEELLSIQVSSVDPPTPACGTANGATSGATSSVVCGVQVPIKYDVDAVVEGGSSVSIESLNNDLISVVTDLGSCHLNKILTGTATVLSRGGDIRCRGVLQGNVTLTTEAAGMISVSKPMCQYFVATTTSGDIHVTSLYADESRLSSETGNIDIGSAHRSVHVIVTSSGNLSIGSLDGSLTAELNEGNISVHVSRHSGVDVRTQKGDIELKLPDSLLTRLELRGQEVNVDEQLNTDELSWTEVGSTVKVTGILQGGGSSKDAVKGLPVIKAHTSSGRVRVTQQDWFSTLKLTTLNKNLS